MKVPLLGPVMLIVLLALGRPAPADEVPLPADEEASEPALVLAEITGDQVNARVGPRVDNRPVTRLAQGTIVIVVEEVPGWYGVQVPSGFPAAVSMDYVEPVGRHGVRVLGRKLNLRVHPPEVGKPLPGIFRDHPALGEVLVLIDIEEEPADLEESERARYGGRWAWVMAPPPTRVYVNERFVRKLPPSEAVDARLAAAREARRAEIARLAEVRTAMAAREAAVRLMETVGRVQQDLVELRRVGGHDKMPIVALANQLDQALTAEAGALPAVRRLAQALRDDLEREIELRVARHDVALARELGRDAPAVGPLEPKVERVERRGVLKYEPTPGWKEEGVYFLWIDDKPAYALRPASQEATNPLEFARFADGKPHRLEGALPGERLFGIPVLEVRALK